MAPLVVCIALFPYRKLGQSFSDRCEFRGSRGRDIGVECCVKSSSKHASLAAECERPAVRDLKKGCRGVDQIA